jgi:hypothetical protein
MCFTWTKCESICQDYVIFSLESYHNSQALPVSQCFFFWRIIARFLLFLKPWLPIQKEKKGVFILKSPQRDRKLIFFFFGWGGCHFYLNVYWLQFKVWEKVPDLGWGWDWKFRRFYMWNIRYLRMKSTCSLCVQIHIHRKLGNVFVWLCLLSTLALSMSSCRLRTWWPWSSLWHAQKVKERFCLALPLIHTNTLAELMQTMNTVALAKFVACCQYQKTIYPSWSTFHLMDSHNPIKPYLHIYLKIIF